MPPLTPEEQARALAIQNPVAAISSRLPGYRDIAEVMRSGEYAPGYLRNVAEGAEQIPGIGGVAGGLMREHAGMLEQGGVPERQPPPPPLEGTDPLLLAASQALGARGAGGGGGSASSSTRMGRPQDVEYLKAMREEGDRLISAEQRLAEQQSRVNVLHDQTIRDWAQEAKDAHVRFGEAGKEMAAEYRATAGELKAARDQLRAMKVDPTRLWDSMPTTQKVLMAIGSLAGGFAEGVSGGKMQNDVGRWWEQAVNRDIEQQRDAIKAKMQEVELGAKERDSIWQKWQQSEDQIHTAAARASQLEISRLALASDDVTQKRAFAKAVNDIGMRSRVEPAHGEFVASQNITTKSYSGGGGGAGKGGGLADITALRAAKKAADAAREVVAIQQKAGGIPRYGADREKWMQARDEALWYDAQSRGMSPKEAKQSMELQRGMWEAPAIYELPGTAKVKAGDSSRIANDMEERYKLLASTALAGRAIGGKKKGK